MKPINTSYDIPYAGGTSKDNKTIYIDRKIPQVLKIGDKEVDVHHFIGIHEEAEKPLLDQGMQYDEAHKHATHIEKMAVEAHGVSWKKYEDVLKPYISRAEHQKNPKLPHDLEKKPYEETKGKGVIAQDRREVLKNK